MGLKMPHSSPPPVGRHRSSIPVNDFCPEAKRVSCSLRRVTSDCRVEHVVLNIATTNRTQHNSTALPVLSRMAQLCEGRIRVQWLDGDELAKSPEEWLGCDILWTLWSADLPLEKLKAYVDRVMPLELNAVAGIMALRDRRRMLQACNQFQIPVAKHVVCSRDGTKEPCLEEHEDYIMVDGQRLDKPFVERPVDANCSDVFVYYPRSAGSGRVRLGRDGWGDAKDDRGHARVRRSGSYVYESCIPSEGFHLRLFVVGSTYVHAKAKHCMPLAFGSGNSGPEYIPVHLEESEKQLARRAALAFGQSTFNVFAVRSQQGLTSASSNGDLAAQCVFVHEIDAEHGGMPNNLDASLIEDIARGLLAEISNLYQARAIRNHMSGHRVRLRSGDAEDGASSSFDSTVNPGNGIPLYANSYQTLPSMSRWRTPCLTASLFEIQEDESKGLIPEAQTSPLRKSATGGNTTEVQRELLAVLAIMRHGDRTPKSKVKLKFNVCETVRDPSFFLGLICGWIMGSDEEIGALLHAAHSCKEEARIYELRATEQMQRLLTMLQTVTAAEEAQASSSTAGSDEKQTTQAHCGQLPSIPNRMVSGIKAKDVNLLKAACNVLQKGLSKADASYIHAKITIEKDGQGDSLQETMQVTLKWGGELTQVGETQARDLGKRFRSAVYPDEDMAYMHASLRHDLKVHSSPEPRCAQTAAAFALGLLSLQCPLAAVQVNFVRIGLDGLGHAQTADKSTVAKQAKLASRALMESDRYIDSIFEDEALCEPGRCPKVSAELEACRNTYGTVRAALDHLTKAVRDLDKQLSLAAGLKFLLHSQPKLREAWPLIQQRWADLAKDSKNKPSETVGAVLDHAKFDMRHTVPLLQAAAGECQGLCEAFQEVYKLSSSIASYSELGEYGSTAEEKFEIARAVLRPLLKKLRHDLRIASGAHLGDEEHQRRWHTELYTPSRRPAAKGGLEQPLRTRLYFAHHSQMQSLVNLLRWAPESGQFLSEEGEAFLANMLLPMGYLCYLTMKLWRHTSDSETTYMVQLALSPGDEGASSADDGMVPPSTLLHSGIPLHDLDAFLTRLCESGGA